MRRMFLVILLIALTPLRSWAGDAMAVRMAGSGPVELAMQAAPEHDDCPGHHDTAASASAQTLPDPGATAKADDLDTAQDHCGTCASCQACCTVALVAVPPVALASVPHYSLPPAGVTAFTSAEVALGQKPPIS